MTGPWPDRLRVLDPDSTLRMNVFFDFEESREESVEDPCQEQDARREDFSGAFSGGDRVDR